MTGAIGGDRLARGCWRPWLALCCVLLVVVPSVHGQSADSLSARHEAMREQLVNSTFQRPLYLESSQTSGSLHGNIYAVLEHPYALVGSTLQGIEHWCDMLILHLNVKGCYVPESSAGDRLTLYLGRKFYQPLAEAYRLEFVYQVLANEPDYVQVVLNASQGPLGTRDYSIALEVVALDDRRSFLLLSYSYSDGLVARLAMRAYLATTGYGKVGFSVVGTTAHDQPLYQGGMLGVVERNTMRYYLAIEAYLGALAIPVAQQLDKRLNDWHSGVEQYPLQLHEIDRDTYFSMKYREVQRQQNLAASAAAQ